jgi:hypothetical protein
MDKFRNVYSKHNTHNTASNSGVNLLDCSREEKLGHNKQGIIQMYSQHKKNMFGTMIWRCRVNSPPSWTICTRDVCRNRQQLSACTGDTWWSDAGCNRRTALNTSLLHSTTQTITLKDRRSELQTQHNAQSPIQWHQKWSWPIFNFYTTK